MNQLNCSADDLAAFSALVATRHFTRAAERCHLSQSAFSQKIRRLEASVGAKLFERSTRQVSLTPEGEVFAEDVARIERDLRQSVARLRDLAQGRSGRVAVAALPSVAATWLPPLLVRYRAEQPQVSVTLHDTLARPGLALLREQRVDMAITAGGDLAEFETEVLLTEPYFVVCRPDHRLAALSQVVLADLAGEEVIHLAHSSSVRQHLERWAGAQQLKASALEVEHLATLAALVAQGLGVSLVPQLALFQLGWAGLVARALDAPGLARPIVLAWRKGQALSVAAQQFAQLLRQTPPQTVLQAGPAAE